MSTACLATLGAPIARPLGPSPPDSSGLKRAAQRSGRILGMYTVQHELLNDPDASAIIANTFSMIADGNDLKFSDRLRPAPDLFNFDPGDAVVAWAEKHNLLFRGHCLVWWNALPRWFSSHVTAANAKQMMTDHISTVVKHYAGRVYSWDVVNESIYHDNRPDGLRRKPWLDFIGPEYIDIAFHTARAADRQARLVLNECYIEHDTPGDIARRASLLALATRLRRAGVPVTHVGVQGHLRGNTPLDRRGLTEFAKQIEGLGLEIMITELDVDDSGVPAEQIDQAVADTYSHFLDIMAPYTRVITFEDLRDQPSLPKRPDGLSHRPNLFDSALQPKLSYTAVAQVLNQLSPISQ
jgi:endo-1,4-beta-xylanase